MERANHRVGSRAFPTISIPFATVSVNWSRCDVFMRGSGAPDYVNNERNWCSPA